VEEYHFVFNLKVIKEKPTVVMKPGTAGSWSRPSFMTS